MPPPPQDVQLDLRRLPLELVGPVGPAGLVAGPVAIPVRDPDSLPPLLLL